MPTTPMDCTHSDITALFDGRFMYFVPYTDFVVYHGRVLRYDTVGSFTNATSWYAYDAGNTDGLVSRHKEFLHEPAAEF